MPSVFGEEDPHAELKLKVAEIYGFKTGSNLSQQLNSMGLSSEAFIAGLQKALNDEKLAYSAAEEQQILDQFQTIQQAAARAQADQAVAMGADFLAKKATEEGVQATGSGLLYKAVKQGDGPKPTKNDRVRVHYRGTLVDGKQFDSSYDRGEPTTFGVGQVIKGWTEGLQLMGVGSTYEFYIPSDLAYGERGAGRDIPPGAVLVFQVELLGIE
jgi:FKBP-type peptidyl-prolyl cis-trans isomerase